MSLWVAVRFRRRDASESLLRFGLAVGGGSGLPMLRLRAMCWQPSYEFRMRRGVDTIRLMRHSLAGDGERVGGMHS